MAVQWPPRGVGVRWREGPMLLSSIKHFAQPPSERTSTRPGSLQHSKLWARPAPHTLPRPRRCFASFCTVCPSWDLAQPQSVLSPSFPTPLRFDACQRLVHGSPTSFHARRLSTPAPMGMAPFGYSPHPSPSKPSHGHRTFDPSTCIGEMVSKGCHGPLSMRLWHRGRGLGNHAWKLSKLSALGSLTPSPKPVSVTGSREPPPQHPLS